MQFSRVTAVHYLADKPVRVPVDFNLRDDRPVSAVPVRFDLDFLRFDYRDLSQCLSKCFDSLVLQVPFHQIHTFAADKSSANARSSSKIGNLKAVETAKTSCLCQGSNPPQTPEFQAVSGPGSVIPFPFTLEDRSVKMFLPAGVIASLTSFRSPLR